MFLNGIRTSASSVTSVLMCAPHAAVRPFLVSAAEAENAPEGFKTKKATGKRLRGIHLQDPGFSIRLLRLRCCVQVCPAKEKALTMKPLDSQAAEIENWNYAVKLSKKQKSTG